VRRIVRLGLWRAGLSVKRQAEAGLATVEEMQGRLAVYQCVRDLSHE